jgi:hypothetical protein
MQALGPLVKGCVMDEPPPMTPLQRLDTTLAGGRPDRVPVVPKIWTDLATRFANVQIREVIEDPELAMRVTIDAALKVWAKGLRRWNAWPTSVYVSQGVVPMQIPPAWSPRHRKRSSTICSRWQESSSRAETTHGSRIEKSPIRVQRNEYHQRTGSFSTNS